jgi:hypothetical protein
VKGSNEKPAAEDQRNIHVSRHCYVIGVYIKHKICSITSYNTKDLKMGWVLVSFEDSSPVSGSFVGSQQAN